MTGLFEIWQFSCKSKKALINSLVGRNVSWDYLVRGVFLPAGLPYRLSCVYRCLQVHCNTAEQDNSCWILDSCAVRFELWGLAKTVKHFQNSEITLNGCFNILGKVRLSDSWVRHNKFPHLFGIEIDWLTLSSKKDVQVFKNESTLHENPWRESVQLVYFTMLPTCLLASACRYHDCLPDKIMHNRVPACSKYVWTCTL